MGCPDRIYASPQFAEGLLVILVLFSIICSQDTPWSFLPRILFIKPCIYNSFFAISEIEGQNPSGGDFWHVDSKSFCITSGVPQGSLIGPILFIFFMSDLKAHYGFLSKYADDIMTVTRVRKGFPIITDASNISDYCEANGLKLNVRKCQQMLITNIRNYSPALPDDFPLVHQLKVLGIQMDSKLSFENHFSSAKSKAASRLTILRQLRNVCNENRLRSIFQASIISIFDYCAPAFIGLNKSIEVKIQRVIDRGERLIGAGQRITCYSARKLKLARNFFNQCSKPHHTLHHYYPSRQPVSGRLQRSFCRLNIRAKQFFPLMTKLSN